MGGKPKLDHKAVLPDGGRVTWGLDLVVPVDRHLLKRTSAGCASILQPTDSLFHALKLINLR